jgi:uncharacterized membrane protein
MNRPAPRSIDEYLQQLREALSGQDAALVQDALYDAEEHLRGELAAHPGKTEPEVLALIAGTYGAPEEVAAAYLDTEVKVRAALKPPERREGETVGALRRFFSVYSDPRAYASLFFMLLTLATGIIYFTFTVTGLSLSAGLAILIIGVPFFLAFIGIARVLSLAEGRLIEAVTGERMPRRPVHPGPERGWLARIGAMLKDPGTWTTLLYFLLMLPLGILYFTFAVTGLSVGVAFVFAPLVEVARRLGWGGSGFHSGVVQPDWIASPVGLLLLFVLGVLLVTLVLHVARGIVRLHGRLAKVMLVPPQGS